eukprot:m.253762 g.253762  ORF g.253762 m.253762 type:complete len:59 (+) comp16164_c0_seq18:241-417(+)
MTRERGRHEKPVPAVLSVEETRSTKSGQKLEQETRKMRLLKMVGKGSEIVHVSSWEIT